MSSEVRAGLLALVLVVVAAAVGVAAGTRARETPAARPVPSATPIALVSASPVDPAEAQRRAFAQPLSSGCATEKAVWLFSDGGAAIRFDGSVWTIPDPTLRSMSAAVCRGGTALAVGGGGGILTADDDLRALRTDRTGTDDLRGLALVADGAVAVGTAGTVLHQTALDWVRMGPDTQEDLFGVDAPVARIFIPGRAQLWVVGANGASYRLVETGWQRIPTGTRATLRGVAQQGDGAIAVGDRGTVLRFLAGAWTPLPVGTDADLRAIANVGATSAWIVGDRGTVIEVMGDQVRRVDVGTACTLRAVFAQGPAVWIVGSDGIRGGAWRVTPTGTDRWGSC